MTKIGLGDAINELRRELAATIEAGVDSDVQFPIGGVTVELRVGLSAQDGVDGGIDFLVLELGAAGQYASESVQTLSITLLAPTGRDGNPINLVDFSKHKPG